MHAGDSFLKMRFSLHILKETMNCSPSTVRETPTIFIQFSLFCAGWNSKLRSWILRRIPSRSGNAFPVYCVICVTWRQCKQWYRDRDGQIYGYTMQHQVTFVWFLFFWNSVRIVSCISNQFLLSKLIICLLCPGRKSWNLTGIWKSWMPLKGSWLIFKFPACHVIRKSFWFHNSLLDVKSRRFIGEKPRDLEITTLPCFTSTLTGHRFK